MAIEWDGLTVEILALAAIIYGAIFVERWLEKRKLRREAKENTRQTVRFVINDLKKRLRFIEGSLQYKDFKPFFTDFWDAIILGGRQSLLSFEVFENLQHTYSWMKYYNNELEQREKGDGETEVIEILNEVKGTINQSLTLLKESQQ